MNHWVIAPVILPLLVAVHLLLAGRLWFQRAVTAAGALLGAALVVWLVNRSRFEGMETYLPGNALPPVGTVLVLDKLATLMLVLAALLHLALVLQSVLAGDDQQRPAVPILQQMLLAGVNGTVLAGDLVTLWLCWSLALVALAGLVPNLWRLVAVGIAALAIGLGLAIWQGGSADLADLADRGVGGTGMAIAVLALWGAGFRATLRTPCGAALGLVAVAVAGRVMTMAPTGAWLVPAALGVAVVLVAVARRSGAVGWGSLVAGTGLALALGLFGFGAAQATLGALWLLPAVGLLTLARLAAVIGSKLPRSGRRGATLALGLCLAALVAGGTLLPGRIPVRFASQFDAITRQLHDPQIYITAVIGLPGQPVLAPEPDL